VGVSGSDTEAQIAGTLGFLVSLGFAIRDKVKQRRERKKAARAAKGG
jgi:alkanesulfonate monooxygenase SsuD/methylene tetrahydromethanopterin reductase-like flavin-dependent oxidoreductase (luciferase family)